MVQHVDDPQLVVSEMARVTVSGGSVVIFAPDWGSAVIHGAEPVVSVAVLQAWGRSIRHGSVGGGLPGLLREAGLDEVVVEAWAELTTLEGYPAARGQHDWDVAAAAQAAAAAGDISEAQAEAWLDELDESVQQGRFLMSLTCFVAKGIKP